MIKETESEILQKMMQALAVQINLHFNSKLGQIENIIKRLLEQELTTSTEWELITGSDSKIRYELGIVNAETKMVNVLDTWLNSVSVRLKAVRPAGNKFTGGIEIVAVHSDYSDVLGLPDVITLTRKGKELNWLKWLLIDGGGVIVSGWHVHFEAGKGRTKGAIMVKKGNWSVPEGLAGDIQDNFITRTIQKILTPLEVQIQKCLTT